MELIDALFDLTKPISRPIIAIDGPAGAGKTTLATHLAAALSLKYTCTIIHMDHLYHGWRQPFDSNFTDALAEIVRAHKSAAPLPFAQYNWHLATYGEPEFLPSSQLLILEGVASSHPIIREKLSVSLWIDIEPTMGLARVLARDGQSNIEQMENWLVLQAQHFAEHQSQMAADFVLTT